MVKISTLVAIAGGCGLGLGFMSILLRQQAERFANQAIFVQRALGIMNDQPAVKKLLGENYTLGIASLNDGFTKIGELNVKVRLPIKGDIDTANLYCYADKKDKMDKFRLVKLEMSFDKIPGKRLVLMDLESPDAELENDLCTNPSSQSKLATLPDK